jgi:peroxiredoxin
MAGAVMRRTLCALLAILAATTGSAGQSSAVDPGRAAPAAFTAGPGIGARIPQFEAVDQDGQRQTFASVRGRNGAVIYFHRSADWCIYCKMQLVELEASRAALSRNGLGLVAISFDGSQALKAFALLKSIDFPLLSDPGSQIIRRFGLLDSSVAPDNPAYGVPLHGSLLVDENGIVRARFFEPPQGHTSGVVLTRLFTSADNTHEKLVSHDHVRLRYSASTLSARAGDGIKLNLEIVSKDDAVLYADDAAGTRVALSWEMDASPVFQARAVRYPRPVDMRIADKPARMYQGTLQLARSITLSPDATAVAAAVDPAGDLVLSGTLRYQACRGERCYAASSVPLRWKVQVPVAGSARPALN